MKAIVISEKEFDRLFDATEVNLKLKRFENITDKSPLHREIVESMHRAFHYELICLKEELKK